MSFPDMNVFRKLQIKMMANILIVHAIILAVLLGILNFYIYSSNNRKAMWYLDMLLQNDRNGIVSDDRFPMPFKMEKPKMLPDSVWGRPQKPPLCQDRNRSPGSFFEFLLPVNPELLDMRNYFALKISNSGEIEKVMNDLHIRMSDTSINQIAKIVSATCRTGVFSGLYQGISWKARVYDGGYLVCFLDRSSEIEMEKELFTASTGIYGISLLSALVFAWLLSVWTVHPVKEDFEKQKQFIADAGHELKTPIAVIGANIDVLMGTLPENKWLGYIKEENERMGVLVKNLLFLAKTDANRQPMSMSDFDLVEAVNCVVLPFESTFYEQGKHFRLETPDTPVMIYGDEQKIKQIIIILVDNAIKNSDRDALIRVIVSENGNRRFIKVYNTGHGIAMEDIGKIFERFYRADTSRTRQTGGYGLGLAIARSIALAHGGTLSAESEEGKWAEFTLNIPSGLQHHRFLHKEHR